MPNRLDSVIESTVQPKTVRLSDALAEIESVGKNIVYIPETQETKSYPVTMNNQQIAKDIRTYEIRSEQPDEFPSISQALSTAKDVAMSLPVFGGFSAKQIEEGKETAESTIFSKEREPAFKWFMMGMPEDAESIGKAETMSWADLFRESPVYSASKDAYSRNVGASTAIETGINLIGEMTDFATDPASLLIAQGVGAGLQKGMPKILDMLRVKSPSVYATITKELGANKEVLEEAYKTLGIHPSASEMSIKRAYWSKVLKTHPDRGGNPQEFDAIKKAYNTINQARENVFSKLYYTYKQSASGRKGGFADMGKGGANIVPTKTEYKTVNVENLDISDEAKASVKRVADEIKPDLAKLKGERLSHAEVVEAAKMAEVLKNGVSREATLKFEAQLLKTRQQLSALAEEKTVTREFIESLRAVSSAGTDIARSLESMKISAESEYATVKIKIIKDLIKLGMETDEIVKAAEGVDFTKQKDATKFYRQFVKPKVSEIIDELRYTNMLSSPTTHIVNTFSNLLQLIGLNPLTKLSSGVVDIVGSQLSGKDRQNYFKQVPAFYRGVVGSAGQAAEKALSVIRGEGFIERPDIFRVGTGIEALQVVPRLLEASDIFFRTMIENGELEALKLNPSLTETEKMQRAKAKSEYYVFRSPVDTENKTGQGDMLSMIDKLTRAAYSLRQIPGVKWFIPFIQTPMNIFKQGMEYSPIGIGTVKGAKDKTEQIGKALIGSMIFLWAASKCMEGRLTWSAPQGKRAKELFYASGRKPYSIKIGDTWVGYNRLGPLSYPLAMAAAWQYNFGESPEALSDSDMEKASKSLMSVLGFLTDQSYVQGVGDLVKFISGDPYAAGRGLANLATQIVPLSGLLKWTNNFIDPFQRETEKGASAEAIAGNIIKNIPGLSNTLPKLRDMMQRPIKKEKSGVASVLPFGMSKSNRLGDVLYKQDVRAKQIKKKFSDMQERALKKMRKARD